MLCHISNASQKMDHSAGNVISLISVPKVYCINNSGDHKSMMEIRDTFRGGHDAQIERRGGRDMSRGHCPPHPTRGLGSIINFSSRVRGRAPAENGFGEF